MIAKPLSELHTGRAGEYVAAADLLLKGFDCFHAAQGMPYDLVVDKASWLYKIQVKATLTTRPIPQRKEHAPAYLFYVHRIKNCPEYTKSKGLYLSDLTLTKALGEE